MRSITLPLFTIVLTFGGAAGLAAIQSSPPSPPVTLLAPTPPMGFNTWNKFGCNVSEQADPRDRRRDGRERHARRRLRVCRHRRLLAGVARRRWPHRGGSEAVPRRHEGPGRLCPWPRASSSASTPTSGTKTCEGRPGSLGHHDIDARTYAEWGIDYIKVDWCNADDLDARAHYTMFRDALKKTGRPIVLSICEWGRNRPWEWAAGVGQLWRTTSDIGDAWESVVWILNANEAHAGAAGSGALERSRHARGGQRRHDHRGIPVALLACGR